VVKMLVLRIIQRVVHLHYICMYSSSTRWFFRCSCQDLYAGWGRGCAVRKSDFAHPAQELEPYSVT
jgi:hypothetical protein